MRTAPFDIGTTLLLGLAKGEGGGLERVDTISGTARDVPGLGGPTNRVGREAGRPGRVVATVGLVRFFTSGQVVEAGGDTVRHPSHKPYTMQTGGPADPSRLPFGTMPFDTLTAAANGLWLAGGTAFTR